MLTRQNITAQTGTSFLGLKAAKIHPVNNKLDITTCSRRIYQFPEIDAQFFPDHVNITLTHKSSLKNFY